MNKTAIHDLNLKEIQRGRFVLYWMQQSQRVIDNPALEYAISEANRLQLPLITLLVKGDTFPEANLRHYYFMLEGFSHIASELKKKNVECFFVMGKLHDTVVHWSRHAALVVTDKGYLRIQRSWRQLVAQQADCKVMEIEGDVLIPVEQVYNKEAYSAKVLRDRMYKLLPGFDLQLAPSLKAKIKLPDDVRPDLDKVCAKTGDLILDVDTMADNLKANYNEIRKGNGNGISTVTTFRGGYPEAAGHLKRFIKNKLETYSNNRNSPAIDFQSNLSPYLHFGQISIRQALLELVSAAGLSPEELVQTVLSVKPGTDPNGKINGVLSFFEEAVVRRELAMNYCFYNDDYDQYSAMPQWARNTLREHMTDPRPYLYDLSALEKGETHDPYWNAAQQEMLKTGKMHGYMRMYWGKKIIQWCREPEEAFQIALYLNNKYELDGRDPNGFAGVAWCFGKHDRPWSAFPVFGSVRTMTQEGLKRKFDMNGYVSRIGQL